MKTFREYWDNLFMSDYKWKEKYCPTLTRMICDPDFMKEVLGKAKEQADDNYYQMLKMAGHSDEEIKKHLESLK